VREEMITDNLDEEDYSVFNDSEKIHSEHLFDISSIIIPFSTFIKKELPSDIYSENDRIPFKNRDPEFKMIIIQEFL